MRANSCDFGAKAVAAASSLALELVRGETIGPGDTGNAMRRLARRHALTFGLLWNLRYRRPKDIAAGALMALALAHETERRHQLERLNHEADQARRKGLAVPDSIRQILALADDQKG